MTCEFHKTLLWLAVPFRFGITIKWFCLYMWISSNYDYSWYSFWVWMTVKWSCFYDLWISSNYVLTCNSVWNNYRMVLSLYVNFIKLWLQGGPKKKVYTCMLQTLTLHKSHFILVIDGKTYINEKVIHERVYFSVCLP